MFNHDLLRDLRKLIQYEERKKEVELKLDQFQMKSPVSLVTPFNTSIYLFYVGGFCLGTSYVFNPFSSLSFRTLPHPRN